MRPEVFSQQVILVIFKIGYMTGVVIVFTGFIIGRDRFQSGYSSFFIPTIFYQDKWFF